MRLLRVTIILLCVASLSVHATYVDADGQEGGAKRYTPFTMTDSWNGWNLLYGPAEILVSPMVMLMGPVVGINAPLNRATEEEGSDESSTWRMMSGMGAGLVNGLAMGPVVLAKGIYDTVTLGLFADSVFE
jgi:hypothetical protein